MKQRELQTKGPAVLLTRALLLKHSLSSLLPKKPVHKPQRENTARDKEVFNSLRNHSAVKLYQLL